MTERKTRILIVGATGMLGSTMLRLFSDSAGFEARGTARSTRALPEWLRERVIEGVDCDNFDTVVGAFATARPDVVINCIGVIKQLPGGSAPLSALPLNSLFPHRLAALARASSARLIHISTDCVFSGAKGNYVETDPPDARDLYGLSKLLGEVDYPNAITLRTSIIGHELVGSHSLLDWFLSSSGPIKGYRRAVFSGLPTDELARVVRDFVLPFPDLHGLYHVSAAPIDKYTLLKWVGIRYGRTTHIEPDDAVVIDRSLNSERFRAATGYAPAEWPELIDAMHDFGRAR